MWPSQSLSKSTNATIKVKGPFSTVCKKNKKEMKNNKTQNKFLYDNDNDDETVNYDLSNTFFL